VNLNNKAHSQLKRFIFGGHQASFHQICKSKKIDDKDFKPLFSRWEFNPPRRFQTTIPSTMKKNDDNLNQNNEEEQEEQEEQEAEEKKEDHQEIVQQNSTNLNSTNEQQIANPNYYSE